MSLLTRLQIPFMRLHHWLYERTDGRVGHRMMGVPTLLLRTRGRRSGVVRTSALVYATDGDRYLVVPSNGGEDRPPGWLHNVGTDPAVEAQVGRRRIAVTATVVAPEDPDHARLWERCNEVNHDRFRRYQGRTSRPIPVVRLDPR